MARGVNKVILIGNIGQDPEVRFTPSGSAVANISLATTDNWKDKNTGERQERTEWHRIVMFNRMAEIAQQYVKKGSRLYIEGRLQTRKWQDQNGNDRYSTEIVANDMQLLDSKGGQQGGQPQGNPGQYQNHGGQGGQQGGYQQQRPPQNPGMAQPAQQYGNHSQYGGQQAPGQGGPQGQPQGGQQANNFGAPPPGSFDDFDDEIPF